MPGAYRNLPKGARILAAMSGGVDSSVAALRLVKAGFDVVGITMHLVSSGNRPVSGVQVSEMRACCTVNAVEDARRVASQIGIPHYVINLADLFSEKVIFPSRKAYLEGRTPNPCVLCNRFIKFDILFKRARQLGCDYVMTGHYAIISDDSDGIHLLRGLDPEKDQSYFLAFLTENDLQKIVWPIGNETKGTIRKEASEAGFKVANRPDSQDLCFLAKGGEILLEIFPGNENVEGEIVTTTGDYVGRHSGISAFTIGQRKGIPGGKAKKMYVVDIDPVSRRVVIGTDDECYGRGFRFDDLSFVSLLRDVKYFDDKVEVQVRYRTEPVMGRVLLSGDNSGTVTLEKPVRAITPGQVAVFYRGDEVLGAGTIQSVERTEK